MSGDVRSYLIYGASSGIGADLARQMDEENNFLILVGRNLDNLEKIKSSLTSCDSLILLADITKVDELTKVVSKLKEEGLSLDGFFHSVGKELIKPLSLIKSQEIDEQFSLGPKSLLITMGMMVKKNIFSKNGASVVVMSSVAASRGKTGLSAYSAAKGAIDSCVKSLAVELASRKIRVNSIRAGAVKTEMHERVMSRLEEKSIKEYEGRHLLGFSEVEDVSGMVKFLLSVESKSITGSVINVDGGYEAS